MRGADQGIESQMKVGLERLHPPDAVTIYVAQSSPKLIYNCNLVLVMNTSFLNHYIIKVIIKLLLIY